MLYCAKFLLSDFPIEIFRAYKHNNLAAVPRVALLSHRQISACPRDPKLLLLILHILLENYAISMQATYREITFSKSRPFHSPHYCVENDAIILLGNTII